MAALLLVPWIACSTAAGDELGVGSVEVSALAMETSSCRYLDPLIAQVVALLEGQDGTGYRIGSEGVGGWIYVLLSGSRGHDESRLESSY